MSTASDALADLDAELADAGQTVTLRRIVANAPAIEAQVRAFVRGYKPDELAAGIQQGDSLVILSPSGMPAEFADAKPTRLRANDRIRYDDRERTVQFVDPVRIDGVLVRVNALVRG